MIGMSEHTNIMCSTHNSRKHWCNDCVTEFMKIENQKMRNAVEKLKKRFCKYGNICGTCYGCHDISIADGVFAEWLEKEK